MEFTFGSLRFALENSIVRLTEGFGGRLPADTDLGQVLSFAEVQIAGGNKGCRCGAKQSSLSEGNDFRYAWHKAEGDSLTVAQRTDNIEVRTVFEVFKGSSAVRIFNTVENISGREIVLESVNALSFFGLGRRGAASAADVYFYRFHNSSYVEAQPRCFSLPELGIFDSGTNNMKVIRGFNVGGWSTKEELPMAIVEDRSQNNFLLFQIENNGGWYYELGEYAGMLFLNLCGPNEQFGAWSKRLKPGEIFEGVRAALCYAPTLNGVLAEMTAYRRKIVLPCAADARLPPIYNEYMHGSFDNPDERNTALLAPVVAKTGAEYYIIDCGWHDEEDAVYSYIGQWKESKKRFPSGVKKTIDFLHSLGLKAGLWIEPESLGYLCGEMLARYNKECFFVKNGEKICAMGRHQLDFRHPKVREYIGGVIDRIAGEWGVDYIKIDYNQCSGAGTEVDSDSLGDGQLEHNRAYIRFIEGVRKKYPNLILEACASGGNRMDYETLRAVSLTSTSDQTDYRRYPYIVGNVFAAVLPEQAGVWSYPVDSCLFPSGGGASGNFQADFTAINRALTPDTVAFNMVNALLGRMHLASKLQYLDGEKFALVREGVSYYNKLSPFKREAVPYLPLGFTDFTRDFVCVGLKSADRLFLAVWNLGGALRAEVPLSDLKPVDVEIGYPLSSDLRYSLSGGRLVLEFARDWQSAVLEITEQA